MLTATGVLTGYQFMEAKPSHTAEIQKIENQISTIELVNTEKTNQLGDMSKTTLQLEKRLTTIKETLTKTEGFTE